MIVSKRRCLLMSFKQLDVVPLLRVGSTNVALTSLQDEGGSLAWKTNAVPYMV